jgi:hypothetical protein
MGDFPANSPPDSSLAGNALDSRRPLDQEIRGLLDVERFSEGLEARFVQCFTQRRVGVNCARDVLQPGAHLESHAEARGKLGYATPDRVNTHDDVVVGPRDDAHEARLGAERHRSAIGVERKHADADVMPRRSSGLGPNADRDQLGIGEADRGDRRVVEGPATSGNDLGHHLALRHGAVRQHRLAGQVADRPDIAHRGGAALVNADERSIHVEVELIEAEALRAGAAAHRHQNAVRDDASLLALDQIDQQGRGPSRP